MELVLKILILTRIAIAEITPGFHFNADRIKKSHEGSEGKMPITSSAMKAHELDPNSSWIFNFEKYGHCTRINVSPFILPKRWTVCYKSNHDIADTFVFLAFLSTKSGNSIIDDFKNKTYREMKTEDGIVNLVNFRVRWGVSGIWPFMGSGAYHKNGLSGFTYGWKRWEQWCAAFDLESGQYTTYVNGVDDGTQIHTEWTNHVIDEANAKLKVKNLVTDVMVGCDPWDWSFGQITDIQMFDSILTHDEMVGMTTCDGDKLSGNIINSNTDSHTLYGDWVKLTRIHPEWICPVKKFSGVFFNRMDWNPIQAFDLCKKLDMKLLSVKSQEDKDNLEFFFEHMTDQLVYRLATTVVKYDNGSWGHRDGSPLFLPWVSDHPFESPEYIFAQIWFSPSTNFPASHFSMGLSNQEAMCVSNDPKDYRISVKILGLCPVSTFDQEYVFSMERSYMYIGRQNSDIEYIGDGIWRLRNKRRSQETKIAASSNSLALGTYDVRFDSDICTKGQEDKIIKITITHCGESQFTWFSGECVHMDRRCDRIVNCPDSSDEKGCAILRIDKSTYIKEYPPVSVDADYNLIKVPINVSIDILKILDINEVEGTFKVSFELHSSWFDDRLIYANLKRDTDLNTLTEQEKEDLWTPNIVFSNTESQDSVIKDRKVIAKISRIGSARAGGPDEAIKTFYFQGANNPITFSRIYDIRFLCSYDMAWYPFDLQRCELLLKPFGNTGKYIYLVNSEINYFGKMDLSKYYIKQWTFESKKTSSGANVEGRSI